MYDVVVVGARCAGAPTAMLFARAGLRVLMVDRASRMDDVLSTLYIQSAGVRMLRSWDVWDDVLATGAPPITRRRFTIDGIELAGETDVTCAPRRRHLDRVLVEAAVAAGAEFEPGWALEEVLSTDGRATGVRCRTPHGAREVPARLVVGADGMRSRVARSVGATTQREDPLLSGAYYTFWPDLPVESDIFSAPGRALGCFRTHDGLAVVVSYFPRSEFARVRRDALSWYLGSILEVAPGLHTRMLDAQRPERLYGTGYQPNYVREATGPGWALVGDAGHHKDSIVAQGITDAFHQAQLLVDRVGVDVADGPVLDRNLRRYATDRDALVDTNYATALMLARLEVDIDRDQWLAVAADRDATGRVLRSLGGSYPEDLADPATV